MLNHEPLKEDIIIVHDTIRKCIHKTPIFTSAAINGMAGCSLFFKCENFQKVGAFKFRGACSAVNSLTIEELKKGVATHSSGNHAAALSLAARMKGAKAYIVMPRTAPQIKKIAVEGYGAQIIYSEPTVKSREETLEKVVEETGSVFVHPYNNYSVIAGQATAAKEIFEELTGLDYLITPVGGGGLLSGSSLSAKYFSPGTKVIGAEPAGADDAFRSVRDNKIYPSENPQTICDGLLTSLGQYSFKIIKENTYKIITVNEEAIIKAMKIIWERMKIIVEPSSAITLALVLENKGMFAGKKAALILSGGNVDLNNLPWK